MLDARFRSAPPLSLRALELRAAADILALPIFMGQVASGRRRDLGDKRSVIVLPGFGASDLTMAPLRYFVNQHGFKALGWGLGTNKAGLDKPHDPETLSWDIEPREVVKGETGVPFLCDLMIENVSRYCKDNNTTVTLVGWSLGGTIAREVARDIPDYIDHVITLGAPVIGGPKYTSAAKILSRRGLDLDWIETEVEKRQQRPIHPPVSAIVSRKDGVVDWSAAFINDEKNTRYIITDVSHLGMGINRSVMKLILEELVREVS